MKLSAAALIAARRAQLAEAASRTPNGVRRRGWPVADPIIVRDTAAPSRPERSLSFDPKGRTGLEVIVSSIARNPAVVAHIDLGAVDADERLSRFAPTGCMA